MEISYWRRQIMILLLIIFIIQFVDTQLVIKACCGSSLDDCLPFERAEDLFGVSCCGNQPYNSYTHLCCSGNVRERNRGGSYAELCCGTQVLRYDQTCCDGMVHNVVNGDCCGQSVFSKTDKSWLCCNQTLTRTSNPSDVCCGSSVFDGGRTQMCCGERVSDKQQLDSCCEKNDGSFIEFHAISQFCCDGVFPKFSNMSCCYQRQDGQMIPVAYNINSLCCRYPYDKLYTRFEDGTCSDT